MAQLFSGKLTFRANPNYTDYLSMLCLDFDQHVYTVQYGDNQAMRLSEKGNFCMMPKTGKENHHVLECNPTCTNHSDIFQTSTDTLITNNGHTLPRQFEFYIETGEWLNLDEYTRQLPGELFTTRLMFVNDPCRASCHSPIAYYLQNDAIDIQQWDDRPELVNKVILSKWETCDAQGNVTQILDSGNTE